MAPALNPVERALKRIVGELADLGVPCALIGGLAVSARAEPRTTRDVDIVVRAEGDAAAEQVVFDLQSRGYVVGMLPEQEKTGRIATVRLTRESERSVYVDLLFASSGIESEIVGAAEQLEVLEQVTVPVATRAHLHPSSLGWMRRKKDTRDKLGQRTGKFWVLTLGDQKFLDRSKWSWV